MILAILFVCALAQAQVSQQATPLSNRLTLPELTPLNIGFTPRRTEMFRLKIPEVIATEFDNGNFNLDPEITIARMFMVKEVDVVRVAENLLETVRRPFDQSQGCIRDHGLYFEDEAALERYREVHKAEKPYISEAEAQETFKFLAGQKHIPYHYPQEGCYARAHEMSELLELKGIASRKAFVIDADHDLHVESKYAPAGSATWNYHVAPIIEVRKADGTRVDMVFDPSIMSAPATLDEWRAKMTGATCAHTEPMTVTASKGQGCVQFETNRYFYTPASSDDPPRTSWSAEDIDDADATMSLYLPISQKYEAAH